MSATRQKPIRGGTRLRIFDFRFLIFDWAVTSERSLLTDRSRNIGFVETQKSKIKNLKLINGVILCQIQKDDIQKLAVANAERMMRCEFRKPPSAQIVRSRGCNIEFAQSAVITKAAK